MSIKKVLMERDGISAEEAEEMIEELRERVLEGEDAEELLLEELGLEPDYVDELL